MKAKLGSDGQWYSEADQTSEETCYTCRCGFDDYENVSSIQESGDCRRCFVANNE